MVAFLLNRELPPFIARPLPPLFVYGLAFAIGALTPHREVFLLLFLLLGLIALSWRRALLILFVAATGWITTTARIHWPKEGELRGTAIIHIEEKRHLGTFTLQGTLEFLEGEHIYTGIPFFMRLPQDLPAIGTYISVGRIVKQPRQFLFIPDEGALSLLKRDIFPLSEYRYYAKKWVRLWIEQNYSGQRSRELISALLLGEVRDPSLRNDFSRFGLQHLLAISGFHFSLLAAFASFLLSFFLRRPKRSLIMMVLATVYLLFLGPSPSIVRAFAATFCFFLGQASFLKSDSLNHLGFGLLVLAIYDPLNIDSIGAVLSFAATLSLLLFADPLEKEISYFFPSRTILLLKKMGGIAPFFQMIQKFLRKSITLNIAVSLAILPLCLFYFETFPLISFFYNLFFPLLVAITLFLLLLSPLPYICTLNDRFTSWALSMLDAIPPGQEGSLEGSISGPFVVFWLVLIFVYGIYIKNRPLILTKNN